MARIIRIALIWLILAAVAVALYRAGRDYLRTHPQDVPWTPLRLEDPVGAFTLRKLAALVDGAPQCRALLREAGARHAAAPSRRSGADCGYDDGMQLLPARGEAAFAPAQIVTSCPVAAAMTVFERQVLQPAARRHFQMPITAIEHAGSYSCRRIYGRTEGPYSEHATADAIDLLGFQLADKSRVSVLRDWEAGGPKEAFLHEVRDGACRLFSTVLSPDYNRAHADHLHFDQASRGKFGSGLCR